MLSSKRSLIFKIHLHLKSVLCVCRVFKVALVGGNLLLCASHDMNQVLQLPSAMAPLAWETQMIFVVCVRKTGTQDFHVFMVTHDQVITQVISSKMGLYSEQFEYVNN